jgi:UDP-N-acetyl-2-amino-2-deoxyglucuronate dehydrogenase
MKYSLALIGCGAISAKHLQASLDTSDSNDLIAICDLDKSRATALAETYQKTSGYPAPQVYEDFHMMLSERKPDAVAVATSSSSHYPIAMDCLNAGAHLILEKPIALSATEAREVVEVAEKLGKKLSVCFITRYAPHIHVVREAIAAGKLGRILHGAIQLRWNRGNDYFESAPWRGTWGMDGGMLMNQGTHGLDLLLWLMGGEISSVFGVGRRFQRPIEAEDFASGIIQFTNGSVAVVEATINTFPANLTQQLSLFGETGTVVLGGTHMGEVVTWSISGDDEDEAVARLKALKKNGQFQGHSALYQDFFESIREEREPLTNGREGLRSFKATLAMYKSMRERKEVAPPDDFATKGMEGIWSS